MIPEKEFRRVLGHFATGVTVVTMRQRSGQYWGFTANSFTSVSLSPPLILVCVDNSSESFQAMSEAEYFAVNFLSEDQQEISRRFALKSGDRFANLSFREGTHGCPLLAGCLGFVECRKVAAHLYGDHTLILGEVLEAQASGDHPLLFYRGSYARLEATLEPTQR
ncbi:MAG: flavin reductase family protein [Acidobacteria bacterium]|nr:flavin reductase family protein [Acidobacteriota bacterium]